MAVRAEKRLSGDAEVFKLKLMAYSVSGFGKKDAMPFCDTFDELMIVRVFKARLKRVMVDISDRTARS